MNRHVKSVHLNEKDFRCEVCQNYFRCNFSLNRHKRLKHKPNSQKCSESNQNDPQQESKPVVIHFMRKEARAEVMDHESFVSDDENTPVQMNFEVQNSKENCSVKNQEKCLEPILGLQKLKNTESELYTRKDTLQQKIILAKLKERDVEKDNSMKKKYSVDSKKILEKFINKSGRRNRFEENRTGKKNTTEEETFVSQYNYHINWWARQRALEAKKKTSQNLVKDDFAKEGIVEKPSNYKIPKYREFNIFEPLDLFYWPSKFYEE